MTTEKRESRKHRESSAAAHSNGHKPSTTEAPSEPAFGPRASSFLSRLPTDLTAKLSRNLYRSLGIAAAVGVGAGVVLGSRILRSAIASTASRAIVEFGRTYLLHEAK